MTEYCVMFNNYDQIWEIFEAHTDKTRVYNAVNIATGPNYENDGVTYYYETYIPSEDITDAFKKAVHLITESRKFQEGI